LKNLAWGDWVQNEADKKKHGRTLAGESHHQAKLTWEKVRAIRCSVESVPRLASQFGVSIRTIWLIRKGTTWRLS
jgi:hypothetical protein